MCCVKIPYFLCRFVLWKGCTYVVALARPKTDASVRWWCGRCAPSALMLKRPIWKYSWNDTMIVHTFWCVQFTRCVTDGKKSCDVATPMLHITHHVAGLLAPYNKTMLEQTQVLIFYIFLKNPSKMLDLNSTDCVTIRVRVKMCQTVVSGVIA